MDMKGSTDIQQMREIIDRAMLRINTAIPGKIVSFDASKQTASVLPAIATRTYIDDAVEYLAPPVIINAPIVFPYAATSGFGITLPISSGDPCLIVFSQRAIDNWADRGDIQPPEDAIASRHHSMTDAFVILAPAPASNVLGGWQTDGIEIRNTDRSCAIKVTNDGIEIRGNITVTGSITSTGDIVADGISLDNHIHVGCDCGVPQ